MAFSADILVVEDDKTFSEYLEKILSFNGYNIQLAQTGQDALKCVWDDKADLVLMDIGLPDMDGYSLMERISIESPETPVILMTGNASIESATKALKNGAYDYLAKPLEPSKLFNTIQNALDRKWINKQRQKAVKKLGESEEKYHQLFESITDAVTIIDAETSRFEDANKALKNFVSLPLRIFPQKRTKLEML
jgi:DNA-binding NtrC family response regulator